MASERPCPCGMPECALISIRKNEGSNFLLGRKSQQPATIIKKIFARK